jgi:hypothetical protein
MRTPDVHLLESSSPLDFIISIVLHGTPFGQTFFILSGKLNEEFLILISFEK